MKQPMRRMFLAVIVLLVCASTTTAHITPPVVLVSDRDALISLLAGARRFFVREVRLSPQERATIQQQTGWTPDEDLYRFYLGRDSEGRLVAAATFLSDFTVHGPVRVAVALGRDGRIRGVTLVELTEETYGWVKPLLDRDFTRQFVGQPANARFTAPAGFADMPQFYGQVIASLVQRAAVLYDVAIVKRGEAS